MRILGEVLSVEEGEGEVPLGIPVLEEGLGPGGDGGAAQGLELVRGRALDEVLLG